MSKKKTKKSAQAPALPTELNENWGTNYGLDGFIQDITYGEGLLERGDPMNLTNEGKSGLPGTLNSGRGPGPESHDLFATLDLNQGLLGEDFQQPIAQDIQLGGEYHQNLTASIVPKQDSTVVDFSWLENAQQDPNRLPQDRWNSVPDLENLWGTRTNGIQRIDLKDREEILLNRLNRPLDDDSFNIDKISHQKKLSFLIKSAMRKSASKVSLEDIAKDLYEKSGHDIKSIKKAFHRIREDHGLVGNVYLRAEAYPNLMQGKWRKQLQKDAKTARYLITSNKHNPLEVKTASLLGLSLVSSVDDIPWKKEAKLYLPLLKATGREIDLSLTPQERLRKAFLSPAKTPRLTGDSHNPQEVVKSNLTPKEARIELERFQPDFEEVRSILSLYEDKADFAAKKKLSSWVKNRLISKDEFKSILSSKERPYQLLEKVASAIALRQASQKRAYSGEGESYKDLGLSFQTRQAKVDVEKILMEKARQKAIQKRAKVFSRLEKMTSSGLISSEQVKNLKRSGRPTADLIKVAEKLASQARVGKYSGYENEDAKKVKVSKKKISKEISERNKAQQKNLSKLARFKEDQKLQKKVARIKYAIEQGIHGSKLATLISSTLTKQEAERSKHLINPLLQKYNALGTKTAKGNTYQNSVYTEFSGQPTLPGKGVVTPKDITQATKFASTQMNAGLAGPSLDQALARNLHPAVLNASQNQLVQLRTKHEGLAGFSYIDPSPYFTKDAKGCDKGAARHRNASIQYLLNTKKCSTCRFNVGSHCGKYKKRIISAIPHDDLKGFKEANIKRASLTQLEDDTFFEENGGYIDEFGLEYPKEEGFTFSLEDKEDPTSADMAISFGGMHL